MEIVVTIGEVHIGATVKVREQKEGVVDAIRLEVLENLFRHIDNDEVRDEGADGEDSAGVM